MAIKNSEMHKESSVKDVCTLGEGGVRNNADKSGQGERGRVAVCGHPFQCGF